MFHLYFKLNFLKKLCTTIKKNNFICCLERCDSSNIGYTISPKNNEASATVTATDNEGVKSIVAIGLQMNPLQATH